MSTPLPRARSACLPRLPRLGSLVLLALVASGLLAARERPLPRLVFVSREMVPGSPLVLGVGPAGRTVVTAGSLVVREPNGVSHPLLPREVFLDVADPAVSYDGRTIAFAAVAHRDSSWRLWLCNSEGRQLRPLTRTDRVLDLASRYRADAARFVRYDDFDPCWLPDGRIVFASTRHPWAAQQGPPVSNLWTVQADGTGLMRITSERDGGEEPSVDPTNGRLVYARWFFNRYLASANGVTQDRALAMPADTVDLWHALSSDLDGDHLRLAGGDARERRGQMAYQPVVFVDTSLVGVIPEQSNLMRATRLGLQRFRGGFAAAQPLFGYGAAAGWSACSPCVLPDGRMVFSMDEHGTGNFALYACEADGSRLVGVVDEPGRMELDAAVLGPRRMPPPPLYSSTNPFTPDPLPPSTLEQIVQDSRTARFDCLNVFANAPVDAPFPDAPRPQRDVRIRFLVALSRPARAGGDTLVRVSEVPLSPQGAVHVDAVPAEVPTFEQLVDSKGRVLRSVSGPAHVAGFNFTRPGAGTKCVGCHTGHSAIRVPDSAAEGEWTNLSPASRVTASSVIAASDGPQGAVDRRTLGDPTQHAWVAEASTGQWLRLQWETPVDTRAVVLYALRASAKDGGLIRVRRSELALFLQGRQVGKVPIQQEWRPEGTRVAFPTTRIDALEIRPIVVEGRFRKRPAAALAEIETIARLSWE
ncbi:MAG: hypothetical protein ABIU54_03210 [Candidatus Eisenbacteria bacterium]